MSLHIVIVYIHSLLHERTQLEDTIEAMVCLGKQKTHMTAGTVNKAVCVTIVTSLACWDDRRDAEQPAANCNLLNWLESWVASYWSQQPKRPTDTNQWRQLSQHYEYCFGCYTIPTYFLLDLIIAQMRGQYPSNLITYRPLHTYTVKCCMEVEKWSKRGGESDKERSEIWEENRGEQWL